MVLRDAGIGTVTHLAAMSVTVDGYLRQRCAWCGWLLIDQDMTRVRALDGAAERAGWPRGALGWMPGTLVEVTGGNPTVTRVVVVPADGIKVPESCCTRLPPEVTA